MSTKRGESQKEGTDVFIEKRYCCVSQINVNYKNVENLLEEKELESSYLGKVTIPGTLFKLELPVMYNLEHDFIYTILAGESNNGFCNLKLNDPAGKGMNEAKSIRDIKTAAVQIFCVYTGLPVPKRSKKSSASCSSCKHKRKAKVCNTVGKTSNHLVCGLDGLVIDNNWHKFKNFIKTKDRGLVGKKEKTTITYEHAQQSPYLTTRNGRYRNTTTMKSKYTDEVVNCPYYAPWFHIAKEDKWVKGISRRLPWDGSKVVGSEIIVDGKKYISDKRKGDKKDKVDRLLANLGLEEEVLRKLAYSNESKEVLNKTLEILSSKKLDKKQANILLDRIMKIRKQK